MAGMLSGPMACWRAAWSGLYGRRPGMEAPSLRGRPSAIKRRDRPPTGGATMAEQQEPSKGRGPFLAVMLGLMAGLAITVFLIILTGGLFFYVVVFAMAMLGFAGF